MILLIYPREGIFSTASHELESPLVVTEAALQKQTNEKDSL